MSKLFEDMTNPELVVLAESYGLDVEVKGSKPTKAELLSAFTAFKVGQEKSKTSMVKQKRQTKAQLVKLDAMRKIRVSVRDMQESQTKDELQPVGWGNKLIGRHTDMVDLSGEPQYIRRGAILNLEDTHMVKHTPKPGGGVTSIRMKRFVVVPVEPLTKKELASLEGIQSMRNSKQA
jgi:hypothetical protein